MSRLPHANLIHNLNLWIWVIGGGLEGVGGGGCMCFASAWYKKEDKLNGALFRFIK